MSHSGTRNGNEPSHDSHTSLMLRHRGRGPTLTRSSSTTLNPTKRSYTSTRGSSVHPSWTLVRIAVPARRHARGERQADVTRVARGEWSEYRTSMYRCPTKRRFSTPGPHVSAR